MIDGSFTILRRLFSARTPEIMMLQTADADAYLPMLNESSRANKQYCSKWGIKYRSYIGLKHGKYPWHATFNRIVMLEELVSSGYKGWVFYLDADAFVYNMEFDVRSLMQDTHASLLAARGGSTGHHWDINCGVFLLNLGTVAGQAIVHLWFDDLRRTPLDALYAAEDWGATPSDQDRLQDILRRNAGLARAWLKHLPK